MARKSPKGGEIKKGNSYQVGIQGKDSNLPEILKLFSLKTLNEIERKIGYTFKDKETLGLAFVHSSFANERNQSGVLRHPSHPETLHNERLEFIGDSVLQTITSSFLYKNLPHHTEGELTELRSYMVGFSVCTHYSIKLGLESYVLVGNGDECRGEGRKSILADLFEAVMGAIFCDGGMGSAEKFFFDNFEDDLFRIINSPKYNFKKALQDFCVKTCRIYPVYEVVDGDGSAEGGRATEFKVTVSVGGDKVGEGSGRSKQDAEQEAAANGLSYISASYQAHYLDQAKKNAPETLSEISNSQPLESESSTVSEPSHVAPNNDNASSINNAPAVAEIATPVVSENDTNTVQPAYSLVTKFPTFGGNDTNWKGVLKERMEKIYHTKDCIVLESLGIEGPKDCQKWRVALLIAGVKVTEGLGASKKKAQQDACRVALEMEKRGELVLPDASQTNIVTKRPAEALPEESDEAKRAKADEL